MLKEIIPLTVLFELNRLEILYIYDAPLVELEHVGVDVSMF